MFFGRPLSSFEMTLLEGPSRIFQRVYKYLLHLSIDNKMGLTPAKNDPYYAVFWTRRRIMDLEELEKIFNVNFLVTRPNWVVPNRFYDWLFGGHLTRYEIRVKADSLHALLSSIRAVLYQKEGQPFTQWDHRLFELISKIYSTKRVLPFLPKIEQNVKWRQHL